MAIHKRAGQKAQSMDLVDIPKLMTHYYRLMPNSKLDSQKVSFGTSGHRGCAFSKSFNEAHILAIVQAIVDYRKKSNINGAVLVGIDTHALSQAASITTLEVLAGNGIVARIAKDGEYTPTPVISHAIICANNLESDLLTDGIILTPSHNPPQDGGIKYNSPHGGPAEAEITRWIEQQANRYLENQLEGVKRLTYSVAVNSGLIEEFDFMTAYIDDLQTVVDMKAISDENISIGVDPMGGAGIHFWEKIASRYNLNITLVNEKVDPTFSFMHLDKDGKIRIDCSSPYAMAGLLVHQDNFDICVGNDPDYDRHGIVCPSTGLMNPNHYLAVAIDYLLQHRPLWSPDLVVGKTIVSSAIIDKVCQQQSHAVYEVPVGFKWFVEGLSSASFAFCGEESAGATFLRRDGTTWCTDKDGFILALLAAEIIAVTKQNPAERYSELIKHHGESYYRRVDQPLNKEQKIKFNCLISKPLSVQTLSCDTLADDKIKQVLTHAPGNKAAIGGIKVMTENGWFAARPSGTEPLFKLYAESFVDENHLTQILAQAQEMIEKLIQA